LYCKSILKRLDDYARKSKKSRQGVSGQGTDNVPTQSGIEQSRTEQNRTDTERDFYSSKNPIIKDPLFERWVGGSVEAGNKLDKKYPLYKFEAQWGEARKVKAAK
jgi:hypothetical protein